MAIKLPEKIWLSFAELTVRWQCTDNDIRRLVIDQTLIPAFRTAHKLTMPDWEFTPAGDFEPSGSIGENSSESYPLEFSVLNHWLYLRLPKRTATFDCEFRLATFGRDDPIPKDPGDVLGAGMSWHWIPEVMTLAEVSRDAAFLLEEVARFEAKHSAQEQPVKTDKSLSTTERNTLLTIIALLCKEVKIDYSRPSKAAGLILHIADRMGVRISETVIENHLKKIPDALGSRTR